MRTEFLLHLSLAMGVPLLHPLQKPCVFQFPVLHGHLVGFALASRREKKGPIYRMAVQSIDGQKDRNRWEPCRSPAMVCFEKELWVSLLRWQLNLSWRSLAKSKVQDISSEVSSLVTPVWKSCTWSTVKCGQSSVCILKDRGVAAPFPIPNQQESCRLNQGIWELPAGIQKRDGGTLHVLRGYSPCSEKHNGIQPPGDPHSVLVPFCVYIWKAFTYSLPKLN